MALCPTSAVAVDAVLQDVVVTVQQIGTRKAIGARVHDRTVTACAGTAAAEIKSASWAGGSLHAARRCGFAHSDRG